MMKHYRLPALGAFAAAAIALTGCAGGFGATDPPASEPAVTTSSPTAEPTADATENTEATAEVDVCAGTKGLEARSNSSQDRVDGYIQYEMVDRGPMPSANGEVTVDDEGNPETYIVAAGDSPDAIAERLCTDAMYLEMLNSIRRNSNYSEEGTRFELYPGDTLNLNRFKIATVGDENGVVYDFTPRIHIPPQD